MHGFPQWFGVLLGVLSWCIDHWAGITATAVFIVVCLVWRQRLVGIVLFALWIIYELTRPLHRPIRTWWKNRK